MNIAFRGARVVDPATGEDAVRDLFVVDGRITTSAASSQWEDVDCSGRILAPGFVDLHATVRTPREDVGRAACAGFTTVLAGPTPSQPLDRPANVRDLLRQGEGGGATLRVAAGLTVGVRGEEIADVGRLADAGCTAFSNRAVPLRNSRITRHVLEYAGRFGRTVLLRAADVHLESGGVFREGPRASWLGLPAVPPEAEEIGVITVAAVVRRTGTPVHLTHLWSRRGVEALRRARDEGLPLSGSTTIHHLALSDQWVERSDYSGLTRFDPPLGDDDDRAALADAVRCGWMAVASDHDPHPPELKDREFELAEPGAVGWPVAWPLVLGALGGDAVAAVRALSTLPARVLGLGASLEPGEPADLVLLSDEREWTVEPATFAGGPANSPLLGQRVRGAVEGVWVHGRPVLPAT